jgi:spore coat polysaccharide biosynthesis protein SpsF
MTTAIIVQARMGSSRLPGKVLLDLAGRPVLAHVLERCAAIPGGDTVVCAIADGPDARLIAGVAKDCGAQIYLGDEHDVLSRYQGAAQMVGADVIMRITSDCPLIDPQVCGTVLDLLLSSEAGYASNLVPRSYPKGLDCEAFTREVLDQAASLAGPGPDREHVTLWMPRSDTVRRANLSSGRAELTAQRWTLDYPEDLEFLRALAAHLPADRIAGLEEVLAVLAGYPEIFDINAHLPRDR